MPKGSKPGERRGGRQKGTPNKRTVFKESALEIMKLEGVNPLQVLAKAARGEFMSELQLKAAIELAKYGWAQRQRVDHHGFDGGPVQVQSMNLHALSVSDLQELHRLRKKMEGTLVESGDAAGNANSISGQILDVTKLQ